VDYRMIDTGLFASAATVMTVMLLILLYDNGSQWSSDNHA